MKPFGVTEPRAFERKLGQNEIKNGDKSTESVLQEGQLSDGGSEKKRRIIYELGLRERLCFAATMGLALILLIGYGYFGDAEHEHLSIGFMALLFLHLILNRRQQVLSRASEIVKNALVLAVSLCLVSGVLLSRYDLPFFPNIPHADLIGGVHLASACWCLVLAGVHVGLQAASSAVSLPKQLRLPGRILVYALSLYGLVTLVSTRFIVYLVSGTGFGAPEYSAATPVFLLQTCAIFVLAFWTTAQWVRRKRG